MVNYRHGGLHPEFVGKTYISMFQFFYMIFLLKNIVCFIFHILKIIPQHLKSSV